MDRRQKLQMKLEETPRIKGVYFQPPEGFKMQYPCIRYNREDARTSKADNLTYRFTQRYTLMVITRDPDDGTAKWLVENLPMCSIDRTYVTNNLYHSVLTLFY